LLAAAQSAHFGVFAILLIFCHSEPEGRGDLLKSSWFILAPIVWVVVEFLYPHLFPSYFANSQYAWTPLVQMADITGVLGISFLLVLVNAALFVALERWLAERCVTWRPLALATMLMMIALVYGYARLSSIEGRAIAAPQLNVGIVQANIGIFEKRDKVQDALQLHLQGSQMLEQQGVQLLVWPETAVTNPALMAGSDHAPEGLAGQLKVPLLTGIYERTPDVDPAVDYNTAVLMMPDGSLAGRYRKQVLLPFGEFIPFGEWFPKLYDLAPTIGRFTRGSSHEPIQFGGLSFGVTICYEDILPRLVRKIALHDPALLVNITNDSWFGDTREPMIHLALATFRAIEHRRALVRATNTGISAIIDPAGRIVEQTPTFQQALILSSVPLLQGRTIYGILGDWVGYLSLGMLTYIMIRRWAWRM
ncbi:MAG: apolipoprotein N-acyltransferase, partial [Deltaproteobacteria bacterium]|nr:apolipoprotein N-acyltransferase [Deltaproteobacteria bacterium]